MPPGGGRNSDGDRDLPEGGGDKEEVGVIYTCKFPGCTRQYASTDGVRKHCRKSHTEWLRKVDEEKASLGCRWAAYCSRQVLEEGEDSRTAAVGSKRAREIMAEGNKQYDGTFQTNVPPARQSESQGQNSSENAGPIGPDRAFGGNGSLVRPSRQASEKGVPPDMVSIPNDLSSALPAAESKLTPNAHARQRLGRIVDDDSAAASIASQGRASESFFAWGMPPLKRGLSLSDTRDALPRELGTPVAEGDYDAESQPPLSRPEAFVDSMLAL